MMPILSEKRQQWLKLLIYGAAGTGKSTLAGSASNEDSTSDVMLITAEGGDIVFQDNDRVYRPELIDMMKADRIEQVQKVYEWVKAHCAARDSGDEARLWRLQCIAFGFYSGRPTDPVPARDDPDIPEDYRRVRRYKTFILDSLTDIEAANMNHILGVGEKGFDIGDEMSPAGYGEFRKNNNTIQQLVRAFRNLPAHVVIICGQRWQKDEMQRFHYAPWLTGQLSTQVQSFVDVVGYMVTSQSADGKEVRKLYVQPVAQVRFDAKCRIASFKGTFFEDPTLATILAECGYNKVKAS
jgi:GTPase SAR1 family protein